MNAIDWFGPRGIRLIEISHPWLLSTAADFIGRTDNIAPILGFYCDHGRPAIRLVTSGEEPIRREISFQRQTHEAF
jgi:hypothetical protein